MSYSAPSSSNALQPPADLDPREALEFEVSQLVDGTLDPRRRPAVEAALAQDSALAALRDELVAVDTMFHRTPVPAELDRASKSVVSGVMAAVHADVANDEVVAAVPGSSSASWWRTWGMTAAAAAAALAVGVSIGVYNGTRPNTPTDTINTVAQTDGDATRSPLNEEPSILRIEGPAVAGAFAGSGQANVDGPVRPGETSTLSVNAVVGPHIASAYAPEDGVAAGTVETPFPDYAAIYNAGVVVEVPSKVSIVSANFAATE